MRLFISAGEPSGDIHGANLIRELRARHPEVDVVGFGGEQMKATGATLLYPLANLAVMGIIKVVAHIATFFRLLREADRCLRDQRPDAVILIDYPGFHWWLARCAKRRGIPVFYFVAPQLWAWAGWRVRKMRRLVDHVLCTLPFEEEWYRSRGVAAQYIGHPFFDELPLQKLDPDFLNEQRIRGGEIVALLPGSRTMEVERNFATLVDTAAALHRDRPSARFLVACFKASQKEMVDAALARRPDLPIESHLGRTPEILDLCRVCVSVSGSVALEIMYRRKPTVIVYRVNRFAFTMAKVFITTPYICLVNLLARRELFPEYLSARDESSAIAGHLSRWLSDASAEREMTEALTSLCHDVAQPGACGRAADAILAIIAKGDSIRRAA